MDAGRPSHLYSAYGLTIASELPCPELPAGRGPPDVRVIEGLVPQELSESAGKGICFQTQPGRALVKLDGRFRLLVRDGREIVVDRGPGTDDDTLRLFLLGTALGLLLQQRGELVLHASTVARDGRAVGLAGTSSAGKSTLAAALVKRGYTLVSDEASLVVMSEDGTPRAIPGAPNLLLWRRALARLDLWRDDLRPVRPGLEKFVLPEPDRFTREAPRLTDLCVIVRSNREEVTIETLAGFQRFSAFLDHTFREPYLGGLGMDRRRQALCQAVVPHVHVHRLTWPQRWTDLDEAIDLLEAAMSSRHEADTTTTTTPGATHAS